METGLFVLQNPFWYSISQIILVTRCDESFIELQTVHEDNTLGQLICLTQSTYSTGITQYKYLLKSGFGVYLGVGEHILNNYSLLYPAI